MNTYRGACVPLEKMGQFVNIWKIHNSLSAVFYCFVPKTENRQNKQKQARKKTVVVVVAVVVFFRFAPLREKMVKKKKVARKNLLCVSLPRELRVAKKYAEQKRCLRAVGRSMAVRIHAACKVECRLLPKHS